MLGLRARIGAWWGPGAKLLEIPLKHWVFMVWGACTGSLAANTINVKVTIGAKAQTAVPLYNTVYYTT